MSIPLLSINFYQSIFFIIWTFIEVSLLVYKNQKYPLPTYAVNIQGLVIAFFILTQVFRYNLLQNGILNKQPSLIMFMIILTVFIIPNYIFFLRLQTYVLLVQLIINSLGIIFNVIEICLALWVWKVFKRKKSLL